jgi:Putative transposase
VVSDGTTHLVFEPLVFLERLAALVPPPRMHQLTYHGVLAPGASWRDDVVPRRARKRRGSAGEACSRYSWSQLMRRVFAVDVLKCEKCGSRRRWISAITERKVIVRILEHLGLESDAPTPAPARAPPQMELGF